jgi:isoquinoline 1-oxidoreductase subunit beta
MRFVNHLSDSLNGLVSRRTFMRGLGGLGTGLVIGVKLGAAADAQRSGAAAVMQSDDVAETIDATGFVRIGSDDTVTVMIKHLEMGQGPYTGLCTLVAEELDADWSQMRAQGAPSNAALYKNLAFGIQGTGGSTAIANSYEQMRRAGATARAMLVAAAAQSWGVPEAEVTVVKGVISHDGSGRQARFAELADQAAKLTPPQDVKLKDPSKFTLIGGTVPKLDTQAKSDGSAIYTIDVDPPQMLTVVIAHPPHFGAKAAKVDDRAARKVRGVTDVKVTPHGVAVYADGFWAAKKARDALRVEWNDSGAEMRSTDQLIADYRQEVQKPGKKAAERGNVEEALGKATRILQAEYIFPYLAHAPMEPLDCAIEAKNGACEAWFGSQLQTVDHKTIAKVMGLPEEKVTVNTLFAGGSFGRRAQPAGDLAGEAAAALKALGRDAAIKLVWTREDDMRGGRYRPFTLHRMKAALDKGGNVVSWDHVVVSQSIVIGSPFEAMIKDGIDPTMVEGAEDLPYAIRNLRVTAHTMEVGVPVLWWRSVGHTHTAFATETFLDELLVGGRKDPLHGRLALLKDQPRYTGVLQAAGRAARWNGTKIGTDRARGVAVHKSFDTYVAQIAEVSRGPDGLPKVEKVWCAVDCGVAVNPDIIKAQMEGSIGFGLGAILFDEITLDRGRVVQGNFNDYRMLRIHEMPKVEVVIVKSAQMPTGVGEPGVPPIGPAVANAWRALTGKGVRHLPFTLQSKAVQSTARTA